MSLQVWLPLNGDLRNQGLDSVTVTNNGATVNNNGKIGKCYQFGTTASDITIPAETMTSFTTECSVVFWLKILTWKTSYATFFQAGPASNPWASYIFGLLRNNTASTCCFTISNGSSASNNSYLTPAFDLSKWYHVALIYKTGHCLIYIDGQLYKDYATSIVPNFAGITTIKLGRCTNGSSYQTNCLMNDFRLYDHALSAKEVEEIAKGLVLHYKLNENYNTLINVFDYPTFNTTESTGGWGHLGSLDHAGKCSQNTDKQYIYNKTNTYSHCLDNTASATGKTYGCYQSPAFQGGYRSLQFIVKEANGLPITETICYPGWNARDGGAPANKWTKIISLGDGFYLCQVNGLSQSGSNDLVNLQVQSGYKIYISEGYLENYREICSDIFNQDNLSVVYDSSGYSNNGTIVGSLETIASSPRYSYAMKFDGTSRITHDTLPSIYTLSCWCKTDKDKSTSQFMIADSGSSMCISFYDGKIIGVFGTTRNTGSKCILGSEYKENDWNHIVVVKTSENGQRDIYCNGIKLTPTTNDYWSATTGFWVGTRNASQGNPFYGNLIDVRAYATALTPEQIKELYNTSMSIDNNGNIHIRELVEV